MKIPKPVAWIALPLCALVVILGLLLVYENLIGSKTLDANPITNRHPLDDPRFGFQYYQPTALPDGFHIVDKRIDISDPDGEILGITAELNLRKVDWVYAIRESRADAPYDSVGPSDIQTNFSNYDPASVKPTCRQMLSPMKTTYRLCHWIDYGSIDVNELKFIKNDTYIYTQFPGSISKPIPLAALDRYVDSFVKADANSFPLLAGGV